jgi:hypothetical protein
MATRGKEHTMSPRNTTFLTTSALVFALALALAGPSQARPVDIGGSDREATSAVIPNDRVGPLGVGGVGSQATSASAVPATGSYDVAAPPASTVNNGGFDWQMLGFGAGAFVLTLFAAALGALMLAGHRRAPAH